MPTTVVHEYVKTIERLLAEMPLNEEEKSSHWAHYTDGFQLDKNFSLSGISGFGNNSPRSMVRELYHWVFQKMLFSHIGDYPKSPNYKLAKKIVKLQNRCLDVDMLRHVFTFDLFDNYASELGQSRSVCIIGDGMSNFVSMASASRKWDKIVSINLPEVLINDLYIYHSKTRTF